MGTSKQLCVGIVGAGFLAETRARCWNQVVSAGVGGVVSRRLEHAEDYAQRFDVSAVFDDLDAMLASPAIDVVDLCVPNRLHREMTEVAAAAGKHVICTKPLTAYTGQDLPEDASDADVAGRDRREMLRVAEADARAMVEAAERAGVQLLYGENWIYAPAFRRALGLLEKADAVLIEMRGGECHSGSHSPYSRVWRHTGGGALIRLAAHPVGAMLHLKRAEGLRRSGKPVRPAWVSAETADLSAVAGIAADELRIAGGWGEVENWGCAVIDSGAGWTTPMPDEDWTSGQLGMCRAFAANLLEGAAAESDGELGLEVVRVLYAAYVASAEGQRVDILRRFKGGNE